MVHHFSAADLNVSDFTTVIEDFTSIFIRLSSIEKLSFTTLSVLHTLSRKGPMRLNELTATEQLKEALRSWCATATPQTAEEGFDIWIQRVRESGFDHL